MSIRGFLLSQIPESEFLYGHSTATRFVSGDEGINIAVALARSSQFADPFVLPTGPTAHVPPSFPFVTSLVFRVFGFGHTSAGIRNGINIVGYGLLYGSFPAAATALGLGANAGVLAGMGAAIVPAFRSNEVSRGRDEWAAALLLLWLTVLVHGLCTRPESSLRDVTLFAVGWGMLLHIQPTAVTVLAAHGTIWLVCSGRVPERTKGQVAVRPVPSFARAFHSRHLVHKLLAAAIVLLMLAPWTIRNRLTMGAWFFVRDNLGIELWISNGSGAQPSMTANQGSRWYDNHPMLSAAAVEEIRRVGEVNFNRRLLRDARSWIAAHPKRFLELTVARASAFWSDLLSTRATFAVRLFWSLAGWCGLFLMWRAGLRLAVMLLSSILVVYPLVYYVIQYSNRYVVAICFAIFVPAGFAADRVFLKQSP